MNETTTFQVEGMTCIGCEQRLGTALRRMEGVHEATADHQTGQLRVRFDPEVADQADLVERISLAGYRVSDSDDSSGADR